MIIKDGVYKNSEGKYDFDYSNDLEYDLIHLCDDDFGIRTAKGLTYFYPIIGRIPPLLSEAKVGNECRLFFTETIDNQ